MGLDDADEGRLIKSHAGTIDFAHGELYFAVFEGKESMVAAHTYVLTGSVLLPALAHDNLTSFYLLISVDLDPQHLGLGVTQVFGCATSFYVGHCLNPFAFT